MQANGQNASDAETWAAQINGAWQKAVASIIETGRLLIQARDALPHGEFGPMIRRLDFSDRTAQRLMVIAANPVLTKPTHVSRLAPHWGTMYELTKFPDPELDQLFAEKRITPDLERHEVEEMYRKFVEEGLYRFARIRHAVREVMAFQAKWPDPSTIIADVLAAMAEEGEEVSLDDADKVPGWLVTLFAGCRRAEEAEVRDAVDSEKRRRIKAVELQREKQAARDRLKQERKRHRERMSKFAKAVRRNKNPSPQRKDPATKDGVSATT